MIEAGPLFLATLPFGDETTVVSFFAPVVIRIALRSFVALVTALLYFDLRKRTELASGPPVG